MLRLELTGDDATLVLALTNALRGPRGLDTELTEADALATAADRVQTGLDRIATGEDRQAAATSAQTATDQAGIATTKADAATVASAGAQSFFNRLYLGGSDMAEPIPSAAASPAAAEALRAALRESMRLDPPPKPATPAPTDATKGPRQ